MVCSFWLSKEVRTQKYDGGKCVPTDNRCRVRKIVTAAIIKTQYYCLRRKRPTCTEGLQDSGKRNDLIVFLRQPLHLSRKLFGINDVRGGGDSSNGPNRMIHQHPEPICPRRPKLH